MTSPRVLSAVPLVLAVCTLAAAPAAAQTYGDAASADLRGAQPDGPRGPGVYGEPYPEELRLPDSEPLPAAPPPPLDDDPYAPLGIRAGSFLLFPSAEIRLGHRDNVFSSATNPRSGAYLRLVPELEFESDWNRHELRGRVGGSHQRYVKGDGDETTDVEAEVSGRLDVTETTEAGLRLSYVRSPEDRGDPAVPAGVLNPPDFETWGGEAHLIRRFGRFAARLLGGEERVRYGDATLETGEIFDNGHRSYRRRYAAVRGSYELREGLAAFAETGINERVYEREVDPNGVRRGSDGYEVLAGVEVDMTGLLTGEVGVGYQNQRPIDPALPEIAGVMFRGALEWRPTALTTVRLSGSIEPTETVIDASASGARLYTADARVEHALRRNLLLTGRLGHSVAEYVGSAREETSQVAAAGLEYFANRSLSFLLEATHARFESNLPGESYDDTRIEVGMKVRR